MMMYFFDQDDVTLFAIVGLVQWWMGWFDDGNSWKLT